MATLRVCLVPSTTRRPVRLSNGALQYHHHFEIWLDGISIGADQHCLVVTDRQLAEPSLAYVRDSVASRLENDLNLHLTRRPRP